MTTYDVFAQGLQQVPFRSGLPRQDALALAASLSKTEGACWIRESNEPALKAERVYADASTEPWLLDEDGLLLGNA